MNIEKIAKDIFVAEANITGCISGGIEPFPIIKSTKVTDGVVTISYKYPLECGLSDVVYHPIQDVFTKTYEFDENGIFKGDIYEALNPSHDNSSYTKEVIDDFFMKYPMQK